jgi:hypothetical protein
VRRGGGERQLIPLLLWEEGLGEEASRAYAARTLLSLALSSHVEERGFYRRQVYTPAYAVLPPTTRVTSLASGP